MAYPATKKQFAFIKSLLATRLLSDDIQEQVDAARARATAGRMTSREASDLIDLIKDAPKATTPVAANLQAGVYLDGETYYRVYMGQQSGRLLAKRVLWLTSTEVAYTYAGAAAKVLSPLATRLTLEQVGALGVASGECLVCGRRLDDPESVDRGIGPVCAKNY